jgi:hypothetical protein
MKLQRFGITPFLGFIILVILIGYISAGIASGAANSTLNVIKAGTGTGTITSSPAGIACGIHCSYDKYDNTQVVTLTAKADTGINFQGWTGCDTVDGNSCGITMTWDATITATFDHNITLDVTRTGTGTGVVTSDPGGISCGAVCSDVYWPGTVVTLTASADAGSTLAGWTGCGPAVANTCVITPTANATVTAAFARDGTVAITKTGTGTGTVTSAPQGINCGAACSYLFPGGTALTLIAGADATSAFQTWTGCNSTSGVNCLISVSGDITPTVQFGLKATLNVNKTGNGTGTVTSAPQGINCGTTCSYAYNPGAVVTLTASPDDNNVFQGWTGCPLSSGNTCTITMTADAAVSAQFESGNKLTVSKPGASGTTVYSNPTGISCASGCTQATGTFVVGQDVTVYAASTNRSVEFAYWTGDCEGTRPCKVTVDRDLSIGAVFASTTSPKYTLAITKTKKSAGDGLIVSHDQSINCGPMCRNGYHMGTPITLTATANLLSTFMGWAPASLNCPATDTCMVTMGPGKMVRAIFTGPQRLIVRKQHVRAGNGTIKSDPAGIDFGLYGTYAEAYYLLNTEVTLTATADTGALFTGWKPASLNCPGIDPCIVTMDKAHAVTAVFTKPKGVGKPFFAEDDE